MNFNLTLIGQSISFLFFVAFCMKFVWPTLINTMIEREKKIEEALEYADKAQIDLQIAQKTITDQLSNAKIEAKYLIENANKHANSIIQEAKEKAEILTTSIYISSQSKIEQEINFTKEKLRIKVSELAIIGAEKIIQLSVDVNIHKKMLEKLIMEL